MVSELLRYHWLQNNLSLNLVRIFLSMSTLHQQIDLKKVIKNNNYFLTHFWLLNLKRYWIKKLPLSNTVFRHLNGHNNIYIQKYIVQAIHLYQFGIVLFCLGYSVTQIVVKMKMKIFWFRDTAHSPRSLKQYKKGIRKENKSNEFTSCLV